MGFFTKRRERREAESREAEKRKNETESTLVYLKFLNDGLAKQVDQIVKAGERMERALSGKPSGT